MMLYSILCISLLSDLINICTSKFPIKEFLNLPVDESQINLCSVYGSFGCCSCWSGCMRVKDCCIDKLWNDTNPMQLDEYVQMFVGEAEVYKDITCENVFPLASEFGDAKTLSYLMVSKCLSNATKEDKAKCNNVNNQTSYAFNIPVFATDSYLYKNIFCARCNFVDQFHIVNITASCGNSTFHQSKNTTKNTASTPSSKINVGTLFSDCTYQLEVSDIVTFQFIINNFCIKNSFVRRDKCLPTSKYYRLCNSYHHEMFGYANYHCYLCVHGEEGKTPIPEFKPTIICSVDRGYPTINNLWSFTISFSEKTEIKIDGPDVSNLQQMLCNDNKVYNIFTNECETYTCSNGYKNTRHTCQENTIEKSINVEIANATFDKCLIKSNIYIIIELKNNSNIKLFNPLLVSVLNLSDQIYFTEILKKRNVSLHSTNIFLNQTSFISLIKELLKSESELWNLIDILYITKEEPIITELHAFDPSRIFSQQRLCATPTIYNNLSDIFIANCSIIFEEDTLNIEGYTQWLSFSKNYIHKKVSTCSSFYLQSSCKLISIPSNFTILTNNQTLITTKKKYSVKEYTPGKHGIEICVLPQTVAELEFGWRETVFDIQSFITYIGASLSIVCYLIIAITYLHFKVLHTIPGYTIIGLSITLLLSDISLLATTQISANFTACKTMGVILHWLFLANYAWLVVIAFDLLSRFGSLSIAINNSSKKRFVKYCVFVVTVPSVIVGIALILNNYSNFVSGYGENNTCFIRNLYPRLCFYIIPVVISFIISGGAFTKAIITITIQENNTRKVLQNSGRKDSNVLVIGLKLVLALGLIEMIGFIQIHKDEISEDEAKINAVFATLFILCRSIRGVILFVIYMCTKHKFGLIKSLVNRNKNVYGFSNNAQQVVELSVMKNIQ